MEKISAGQFVIMLLASLLIIGSTLYFPVMLERSGMSEAMLLGWLVIILSVLLYMMMEGYRIFKVFMRLMGWKTNRKRMIAILLVIAPVIGLSQVELVAENVVSSEANEFNSVITKDGKTLYFVRADKNFKNQQIYFCKWENKKWSDPKPVSFCSSKYSDSDPSLSPDNKTMYFFSNRPVDGDSSVMDYNIWLSELKNSEWTKPVPFPAVNSCSKEIAPEFACDYFMFASNRYGGLGKYDIYFTVKKGKNYIEPVNLKIVNSEGYDADPALSPDCKLLLFASAGRADSKGSADIYLCKKNDNEWSVPVNVSVLNTASFDFCPFFTADGKYVYYSSSGAPTGFDATKNPLLFNGHCNIFRIATADLLKSIK
jgi:hypothetical protein